MFDYNYLEGTAEIQEGREGTTIMPTVHTINEQTHVKKSNKNQTFTNAYSKYHHMKLLIGSNDDNY